MHVSAALATPTVAIFGPTSPWHWKPLNPVAAILEPPGDDSARARARNEGNDAVRHHRTDDVTVAAALAAVRRVLAESKNRQK
jgi:heptosyltransferase-2